MINHILGRMSLLNYWRMLGIQGNRQYTRMVWPFSFLKNKSFSLLRSPEISPFFYQSVLVSSWISARICQGVCSLKLQASTAAVQGVQAKVYRPAVQAKGTAFEWWLFLNLVPAPIHYSFRRRHRDISLLWRKNHFAVVWKCLGAQKRPYWDKQIHKAQEVDKCLELFGRPGKHQCSRPKCSFSVLATWAGLGYLWWFIYISGFLIQKLSLRARTLYALSSCRDFKNLSLVLCYPVWLLELTAPTFHRLTSAVRAKSV